MSGKTGLSLRSKVTVGSLGLLHLHHRDHCRGRVCMAQRKRRAHLAGVAVWASHRFSVCLGCGGVGVGLVVVDGGGGWQGITKG